MRRLLLVVAALLVAAPAVAQSSDRWRMVHFDADATISIDMRSFDRDQAPGVHAGWFQWYYPDGFTDSGIDLDEVRFYAGLDCRRRRISIESVLWMNRGRAVREVDGDRTWRSPEPDSIPEFIVEAVCAWVARTPAG